MTTKIRQDASSRKRIGFIDPQSGIWEYIQQLPFKIDTYKSTVNRKILPIKNEIKYNSKGNTYQPAYREDRIEAFLSRIMPNWGTALALQYKPGGSILQHRDTTGYGITVASVSSCDYILKLDGTNYKVKGNQVISFPSKIPHAAWHETDEIRYTICCWELDTSKLTRIN